MAENIDDQLRRIEISQNNLDRESKRLKEEFEKLQDATLEKKEKEIKLAENLLKQEENRLKIKQKFRIDEEADYIKVEEKLEKVKSLNEEYKKQKEILEEITGLSRSLANDISEMFGVIKDINESGLGQFYSLTQKAGGAMAAINRSAIELSKNLGKRVALSVMEKGQEAILFLGKGLDDARAAMAKTIPEGKKYQGMVSDIASSNEVAYASFQDVAASVQALNTNFSEFSLLAADKQKVLVEQATTLEQLGVSADTYAESLNLLTKGMGFSTDEFVSLQAKMFTWSKKLGINMDVMNKNLATALPRLSQFGKTKAIQVFKDMTVASKSLGIEMNKLLDITANFDTFEGAAEAAGSLNSVLGGNVINTLDLMNAALDNPIEVFKQFKGALDKTGKSFSQMTPAMKKTIAEMMKMDVSEVERLANQDLSRSVLELQNVAASQEEMNQAARDATPILEKMQKIAYKFAIAISPLVDALAVMVDLFAKIAGSPVGKVLGFITMAIGALGTIALGAIKVLVMAKAALVSIGLAAPVAGTAVAGASTGISTAITTVGGAATRVMPGILALGASFALAAAGIGAAAYGLSFLVTSFKGLSADQILGIAAAIGVFMAGLAELVAVMFLLSPLAVVVSGAFLPFALTLMLVSNSISSAATAMKDFTSENILYGLSQIKLFTESIADNLERIRDADLSALSKAVIAVAAINAADLNATLTTNATEAKSSANNEVAQQIIVNLPNEAFKVHMTVPVTLDGVKMGDFVQEQIVKRENKLVPGRLQTATGIKVGGK